MNGVEVIPLITDKMGRNWEQPNRDLIELDETHALMSWIEFDKLAEYSCSLPTGTYVGKMWKRHFPNVLLEHVGIWYLCWYDKIIEDHITIERREIIIA